MHAGMRVPRWYRRLHGTGGVQIEWVPMQDQSVRTSVLYRVRVFALRNYIYICVQVGVIGQSTTTDRVICPGSKGLFVPVLEPGQGRRDKSTGGFCPGW